jgi:hypothetical protein
MKKSELVSKIALLTDDRCLVKRFKKWYRAAETGTYLANTAERRSSTIVVISSFSVLQMTLKIILFHFTHILFIQINRYFTISLYAVFLLYLFNISIFLLCMYSIVYNWASILVKQWIFFITLWCCSQQMITSIITIFCLISWSSWRSASNNELCSSSSTLLSIKRRNFFDLTKILSLLSFHSDSFLFSFFFEIFRRTSSY